MYYIILASTAGGIGQLITVLLIFVFVLALTFFVTKWIANYQKEKAPGENIVILESKRIAPGKLIEVVRIGDRCFAIAIGKDEVTLLGEVNEDSLKYDAIPQGTFSFKDFLNKARDDGETDNK